MVKDLGNEWKIKLDDDQIVKFFKDNYKYFKNYAGDIETFLFYVKLEHSKRLFCNNKYDVDRNYGYNYDVDRHNNYEQNHDNTYSGSKHVNMYTNKNNII